MTESTIPRLGAALALAWLSACSSSAPQVNDCTEPFTAVHRVQGSGPISPLVGQHVTVRGVVVGDFQEDDQLRGFFLQDLTPDDDPRTSEGLFVYAPDGRDVAAGDLLQVSGRVEEYFDLTELTGVESIEICRQGAPLSPTPLSLFEHRDLEPFESMLVAVEDELTVAGIHELGRYGHLLMAAGGRPFASTNGEAPNAGGSRRLLVGDGSRLENPATPPYLDAAGTRRVGDTVAGLTGVISEEHDSHVLHPTAAARFVNANPRPPAPPTVGGTVRVASFNVLNYFTTLGERGASHSLELRRQRAKLVAAIEALGADIVGLIELESTTSSASLKGGVSSAPLRDGSSAPLRRDGDVAIRDLVDALNTSAGESESGEGTWAHVPSTPDVLGDDVIRLGFIYRPAVARPIGDPVADPDPVFKRPPLAQTFEAAGERFTVVVNHFKSKSCGRAEGIEKNDGDGQGCWNALRTRQARQLVIFVARLQALTGDQDVLVLGDLNAYGAEDPIRALTTGGLIDQVAGHVPPAERYSYVYGGESGYLDHALTTPALADRVSGAAFWHINCDEPAFLDYNTESNPPELFRPDPYRSSDHDPVLIGLDF